MATVYKPIEFVVDNLLAQGLYILAGSPKVGKSLLARDMCLSIAKGEKSFRSADKERNSVILVFGG